MAITRRQREVYDFISRFVTEHGYSPSFEEIGQGLKLNSLATVHKHISNLEKKGLLTRDYNRVIRVQDKGTVTQEEIDRIAGDRAEARAAIGMVRS